MASGFLRIEGNRVVNGEGRPLVLRGFGLGGWMNMENFITGYPANEEAQRRAVREVLGQEKYELFFDRFLEHYFTEGDAHFIRSLGLNLLRLPVNYRHFEDDAEPFDIKEEGFKHLDRVIAAARFPFLSANTVRAGTGEAAYPEWVLVTRMIDGRPLGVGVTGVLPPGVALWDRDHVEGRLEFPDMVDRLGELVLGEIKKSSSGLDASILQLAYYLYRLEQEEIKARGEILIPKDRKRVPVVLDEELQARLAQATIEIEALLQVERPPKARWLRYCPNCAYSEFCWSGEGVEEQ
jgi:hypothetical protein